MDYEIRTNRHEWLSVLPKIDAQTLDKTWKTLSGGDDYTWIRPAETGAVMVRGRMGGSGAPFNMGEMTVTRATVRLADGTLGFGYAAGRAHRKAELVALLDAIFQQNPALAGQAIPPLVAELAQARNDRGRKAASTKVEFFTVVRGDNPK